MNEPRRGFTLIELLIVVAVSGFTVAAVNHFHLQARVSLARLEADLVMERSASLAAAWLGRLGRNTKNIRPTEHGLEFESFDGQKVEILATERRLVERRGAERLVVARHIDGLRLTEAPESWVIEIHALRPLIDDAEQRRTRSLRIPRWR